MVGNERIADRTTFDEQSTNEIEHRDVAARSNGNVQIGDVHRRRPPRVNHDNGQVGPIALRIAESIERDRVRLGHVPADNQDQIGVVDVVIATRRPICSEAGLVAGHRGRHAQPAVGIGVIATQAAFEELDGRINGLCVELPGPVKCNRFRTMIQQDVGESFRQKSKGDVPIDGTEFISATTGGSTDM